MWVQALILCLECLFCFSSLMKSDFPVCLHCRLETDNSWLTCPELWEGMERKQSCGNDPFPKTMVIVDYTVSKYIILNVNWYLTASWQLVCYCFKINLNAMKITTCKTKHCGLPTAFKFNYKLCCYKVCRSICIAGIQSNFV